LTSKPGARFPACFAGLIFECFSVESEPGLPFGRFHGFGQIVCLRFGLLLFFERVGLFHILSPDFDD
jgi:hypothetical protein